MTFIDTSAWIEFLRNGKSQMANQVAELLQARDAAWCGMVALELANTDRAQDGPKLRRAHQLAWMVDIDQHVWLTSCKLASAARRRSITAPLPDYVIFVCSKLYNLPLLHSGDKDFSRLETVYSLI